MKFRLAVLAKEDAEAESRRKARKTKDETEARERRWNDSSPPIDF